MHKLIAAILLVFLSVPAFADTIHVKRGTDANIPATFGMGEPAMTTDTHRVFMGYSTGKVELAPKDNPTFTTGITTPVVIPSSPDGTWRMNVRNSVTRAYTPQEGDMDTDAAGRIWLYVSGQWVEKGAAPPTASSSTAGVVKVGDHLTITNGVLDVMLSSLGSSGLVTAGLSGDATIRKGFAYVTASSGKWTFAHYSSGTSTIFSNYTGTLCAATAGGLNIQNPITFANRTSSCAKVYAGTYATIQSKGDGKYWVTSNRNLTKQGGAASGTGGGGGGSGGSLLYWSASSTSIDSPLGLTATAGGTASLVAGGPTGNYIDVGGPYHAGSYSIPITTSLLNKTTTGRVKLSFYFTTGNGAKWLFYTAGDGYYFHGKTTADNKVEFRFGETSYITTAAITPSAWHTAEFYWSGDNYGVIVDGGSPTTGVRTGQLGTGTSLILGIPTGDYAVDRIDEVYLYAN